MTQQSKLDCLIHNHFGHLKTVSDSCGQEDAEKILLCARKHKHSMETDNLEAQLQGMQRKVKELEKVCTMMQSQMFNATKPRIDSPGKARALPKLCS